MDFVPWLLVVTLRRTVLLEWGAGGKRVKSEWGGSVGSGCRHLFWEVHL